MSDFLFNVPINPVSFGVVSVALLREAYDQGLCPPIISIGDPDLRAQNKIEKSFSDWIETNRVRALFCHKKSNPTIKLWHISGSLESFSKDQDLITFHETNALTKEEINILNQQRRVYVTSRFSKDVFNSHGVKNAEYLELGFDSYNFEKIEGRPYDDDRVVWGLGGKLEPVRKQHAKILQGWIKKFGNNRKHFLHAFIYNPFLKPEDNNNLIGQILGGQKYSNVKFYPSFPTNSEYNAILNSIDIMLALSGGEGRDLPVFHAAALGKHVLGLNAHAYKDYLDAENAVLIEPNGIIPAEDGMFFRKGSPFNQGGFFDWSQDDFISACDVVVDRFLKSQVNTAGLCLKNITFKQTWSTLFNNLEKNAR